MVWRVNCSHTGEGELLLMDGRISIRPHHNSPMLQFIHVAKFIHVANSFTLQFTHVDRRIAIRPYTCVIRTLANIHINHVNTKKRRHGHGIGSFACVVGAKSASWRSGVCDEIRPHRNLPILQNSSTLQFVHITIHPHRNLSPSLP